MFVNGVRDIGAISRDDLLAEAERWGIPADRAAARIEPILRNAEDAMARSAGEINCPKEFLDVLIERARAFAA
jgi:hypothetical protein